MPGYSYRFILERFKPALCKLGEAIDVTDSLVEIPKLQAEAAANSQACRLFCFCPPNLVPASINSPLLTPTGQDCPITVVTSWGYDSIPTTAWGGDHRNDWRNLLNETKQVITLSEYSRTSIAKAMGDDYKISVIPVPIDTSFCLEERFPWRKGAKKTIHFQGLAVDNHRPESVAAIRLLTNDVTKTCTRDWDGEPVEIAFKNSSLGSRYLVGFYPAEAWGAWSMGEYPSVLLPFELRGAVRISLIASAYGRNLERDLSLQIGRHKKNIRLTAHAETYTLSLTLNAPTNIIKIGPCDVEPIAGAVDGRTMGVGLTALKIESRQPPRPYCNNPRKPPVESIELSGVVFTSVLNPEGDRKNWTEILRAFAYALGAQDDAVLLLKISHYSAAVYISDLLANLNSIGPMRARVVVLHGYLNDHQYQQLRKSSDWYVNASACEGFCLPLVEFMAGGIPAIAPNHTAMADYVDSSSTLLVSANLMPTFLPDDPSMKYRCTQFKVHWQSLVECFREGYRIATQDHERYESMSTSARHSIHHKMSVERATQLLAAHLGDSSS